MYCACHVRTGMRGAAQVQVEGPERMQAQERVRVQERQGAQLSVVGVSNTDLSAHSLASVLVSPPTGTTGRTKRRL